MKLKKDAEIINKMIVVTPDGQIFSRKEYLPIVRKRRNQENSTSEDEELKDEDEHEIFSSPDNKEKKSN